MPGTIPLTTVALGNNDTTAIVTGLAGPMAEWLKVDDKLVVPSQDGFKRIASWEYDEGDDTFTITLKEPWLGSALVGQTGCYIEFMPDSSRFSAATTRIIATFEEAGNWFVTDGQPSDDIGGDYLFAVDPDTLTFWKRVDGAWITHPTHLAFTVNKNGVTQVCSASTVGVPAIHKITWAEEGIEYDYGDLFDAANEQVVLPPGPFEFGGKVEVTTGVVAGQDLIVWIYRSGVRHKLAGKVRAPTSGGSISIPIDVDVLGDGVDYFDFRFEGFGAGSKTLSGNPELTYLTMSSAFGLPGPQSEVPGPMGPGLELSGAVPAEGDLPADNEDGDAWLVIATGDVWTWDALTEDFVNAGPFKGDDGREVELRRGDTHVQWRYAGETEEDWQDLIIISDLKGDKGDTPVLSASSVTSLTVSVGSKALETQEGLAYEPGMLVMLVSELDSDVWMVGFIDSYTSNDLVVQVAWTSPDGVGSTVSSWLINVAGMPGREIEVQKSATHIQWRYAGAAGWTNLVALVDIKGDAGDTGPMRAMTGTSVTEETIGSGEKALVTQAEIGWNSATYLRAASSSDSDMYIEGPATYTETSPGVWTATIFSENWSEDSEDETVSDWVISIVGQKGRTGEGLIADVTVADLADRDAYDGADVGFIVGVSDFDGTGRTAFFRMEVGGWGPALVLTGPSGDDASLELPETILTATGTIGVAHINSIVALNVASATSFTLDAAATVGAGSVIHVKSIGDGACTINAASNIDGKSSIVLNRNDYVVLVCNGTTYRAEESKAAGSEEPESSVAIVSNTANIGAANNYKVVIAASGTITSLGTMANRRRRVRFPASVVLTHHATSLILPSARNITTMAGDVAEFESDSSGNWRLVQFFTANAVTILAGQVLSVTTADSGSGDGAEDNCSDYITVVPKAATSSLLVIYSADIRITNTTDTFIAATIMLSRHTGAAFSAVDTKSLTVGGASGTLFLRAPVVLTALLPASQRSSTGDWEFRLRVTPSSTASWEFFSGKVITLELAI